MVGFACAFAALVLYLGLGREHGITELAASGVFVGVLLVSYPVFFYFCKHHYWTIWRYVLFGLLCGMLSAFPFSGSPKIEPGFLFAVFEIAGALLGFLFWVTAIWRNKHLTCPKTFCLPCGTVYRVARNALTWKHIL